MAHDSIGASKLERVWNCPGSNHLAESAPAEKPSFYASEGTAAHTVASYILTDPDKLLHSPVVVDGFDIPVDDEMLDAVCVYTDFIASLIQAYDIQPQWIGVESMVKIPDVEVWSPTGYIKRDLFGTADWIGHVPYERLIVVDYKHGRGVKVDAKDNKQLLFYGLGAFLSLSPEDRADTPIIQLVIVQPRCPGGGIDSWEITREELLQFHDDLLLAAFRVKPGAQLSAGEWCKFCPAKPICPAILGHASDIARLDFNQLPAVADEYSPPVVTGLDTEQLVYIHERRKQVEDWFDAISGELHRRVEQGETDTGYKIVDGVGRRKYVDEDLAGPVFKKLLGAEAFTQPKLLSPNQLQIVLRAKKLNAAMVDEYTYKPEGKPSLVKASDKREPSKGRGQSDFINVEAIETK